ncbi:integrase core domain-containing protein [Gimesia sp.]|uniref:integrase core domain-containing protein n=1 Tax=Gimesia sp. TaxID=2024833 RepID=UPI003A8D4710
MIAPLAELFSPRGVPQCIRSDNGPEFDSRTIRRWLSQLEINSLYIEPGASWENSYIESFIGKLRDELLNGEILDTLWEAKLLLERWRRD